MFKNAVRGIGWGLFFGLCYAWGDTLFVFKANKIFMRMDWDPFTPTTLSLAGLELVFALALSMLLGLFAGHKLLEPPTRFIHAMAAGSILMTWFGSPEVDLIFGMALAGVGIAHGLGWLGAWLWSRQPLATLSIPILLAFLWYPIQSIGLPARAATTEDGSRPVPTGKPNVLWVVFDTTRADHLPMYGYHRNTTPTVSALAEEGVVFERAYSTAPWTLASHAGMFTGTYSIQHGCTHEHLQLAPDRVTAAEVLYSIGYETGAFAGNPWFDHTSGLTQGFRDVGPAWRQFSLYNLFAIGRIRLLLMPQGQDKGGTEVVRGFKEWLEQDRDKDRPFFGFLNFLEPHSPYEQVPYEDAKRYLGQDLSWDEIVDVSHRHMSRQMFATDYVTTPEDTEIVVGLYDGGIYNADRRLGEVIALLKAQNLLDNTLIVLTSDHGEMFGEHDIYGHDVALYHPLVHVPMVVRYPAAFPKGQRVDNPVQTLDIFPTLAELIGIQDKVPSNVRGRSLLEHFRGQADPMRPVFAEHYRPSMTPMVKEIKRMGFDPQEFRLKSVQIRDHRLIRWPRDIEKVFDIKADPGELKDLKATQPELYAQLKAALDGFVAQNPADAAPRGPAPQMDKATCEKLRSLGYVQDCPGE